MDQEQIKQAEAQFNEKFPTLSSKEIALSKEANFKDHITGVAFLQRVRADIVESCLDKKLVAAAIEKYLPCDSNDEIHHSPNCNKCKLKTLWGLM